MEINSSFPALILASGYIGFACAACLGKAGLSYLFMPWVRFSECEVSRQARKCQCGRVRELETRWQLSLQSGMVWEGIRPIFGTQFPLVMCLVLATVIQVFMDAGWLSCGHVCRDWGPAAQTEMALTHGQVCLTDKYGCLTDKWVCLMDKCGCLMDECVSWTSVSHKPVWMSHRQVWVSHGPVSASHGQVWVSHGQVWGSHRQVSVSHEQVWVCHGQVCLMDECVSQTSVDVSQTIVGVSRTSVGISQMNECLTDKCGCLMGECVSWTSEGDVLLGSLHSSPIACALSLTNCLLKSPRALCVC